MKRRDFLKLMGLAPTTFYFDVGKNLHLMRPAVDVAESLSIFQDIKYFCAYSPELIYGVGRKGGRSLVAFSSLSGLEAVQAGPDSKDLEALVAQRKEAAVRAWYDEYWRTV